VIRAFLVVSLLVVLQTPTPLPEPTLAAAAARLQAADPAGAARILEEVVKREPGNGRAWRNLGVAYQGTKEYDKAIAAYRRALEAEPAVPTPMYQLGLVYALRQEPDRAFEWLARARDTRKIDMTQATVAPELEPLRKDVRFAALLPSRADFDKPFVEDVRILREWDGEAANDQFGWIARNIGDVDGDGVADVVTSAPTALNGAGRIYVYSTKTGAKLWTADGSAAGDQLGSGVEGAGDTNKDGIPDVVASAPMGGYARVYSGRDGRILLSVRAENAKTDAFGTHAAGAGDVDKDGYADVIVGAPGAGGGGRAYIYSGKSGALLMALSGERPGDRFGNAVAGGSDARGRLFVLVGAPRGGPRHVGRAYVYDSLTAPPKFVIDADQTGVALGGMFLSIPGDVDGDGVPDVYASDWQNAAKGQATGRVYLNSGADGHPLFAFTGETAGEGFGTSPSTAGDVDGDGHADLIVGAWQYSGAAIGGGRAYLYSGKDGRLMKTYTCRIPGDTFGFDAVTLGDIDGDGTADFLITSGWSGISGFHAGRVFIISSGVARR
jgi:Tetratricopeptide repeat/FG-GAP-like repeat/FG-GAP repeat